MEINTTPAPKRRLSALARVARRARIFARLREGWAYDEIACDERLTAERVRQIVREALERRLPDEDTDHAKLQLDRLRPAMRVATAAVEEGDVRVQSVKSAETRTMASPSLAGRVRVSTLKRIVARRAILVVRGCGSSVRGFEFACTIGLAKSALAA